MVRCVLVPSPSRRGQRVPDPCARRPLFALQLRGDGLVHAEPHGDNVAVGVEHERGARAVDEQAAPLAQVRAQPLPVQPRVRRRQQRVQRRAQHARAVAADEALGGRVDAHNGAQRARVPRRHHHSIRLVIHVQQAVSGAAVTGCRRHRGGASTSHGSGVTRPGPARHFECDESRDDAGPAVLGRGGALVLQLVGAAHQVLRAGLVVEHVQQEGGVDAEGVGGRVVHLHHGRKVAARLADSAVNGIAHLKQPACDREGGGGRVRRQVWASRLPRPAHLFRSGTSLMSSCQNRIWLRRARRAKNLARAKWCSSAA